MHITLYQEYENDVPNSYTSDLMILFRKTPTPKQRISSEKGNTLEKALQKIGRDDIVKKCIFNVELVTDDVEKAVAKVRIDQPGFDSLKEELGPSRDTSLRRNVTLDPKLDPDYEEPDRMKDSESLEDLVIIASTPEKPTKPHVTITNGTVFNGTSTPKKDKYASDEKEFEDMMADFVQHKYQESEPMTNISHDDDDDDDEFLKRQQIIADASKLVSDVTEEAERRAHELASQGLSFRQPESDFLQQSEPSYMETTTTEIDPETNERITRTTRVVTTTGQLGGVTSGTEELRESMQKIVDQFMVEDRKGQ